MAKKVARKALGRGLGALLPSKTAAAVAAPAASKDIVAQIPIDIIDPNPAQPRSVFRPEALEELAQSIRVDGMLQPILVRRNGKRYYLIVGERRLRASKIAGLETVPAIVREIEPDRILEVTLVENIQRENLNPIEIAAAFEQMVKELGLSHEELASRTGKSRTAVTNYLRLLKLPKEIKLLLRERRLQMGHARAILSLDTRAEQLDLAEKAVARDLSVREVERIARKARESSDEKPAKQVDPNISAAIEELERALGAPVRLVARGRGGSIQIEYGSDDDLDRIYSLIVGED